jgi:hypothetical protein
MKQTTVEWLEHMLLIILNKEEFKKITYAIEQAKEMEKQQIIDAYQKGIYNGSTNWGYGNEITSEQYYNETFNK